MTELVKTTCSGGTLIVTETNIIIRLGRIKEQNILRAALTGVDSQMGVFVIYGSTRILTFHRQGGSPVIVKNVPKKKAQEIMALLNA